MEPEQSDGARSRMQSSRPLIVAVLATVAGVAGAAWLLSSRDSVATDNAYLKADSSDVPPQVPGLVIAVRVEENQQVAAGDVLVELDPDDYLQRVSSAEADVAASRASLAAAEAALRRLQSQQRLAEASVEEVSSRIRAADAQRGVAGERDSGVRVVRAGGEHQREVAGGHEVLAADGGGDPGQDLADVVTDERHVRDDEVVDGGGGCGCGAVHGPVLDPSERRLERLPGTS